MAETLDRVTQRHHPAETGWRLTRCSCDFVWRSHEEHAAHLAEFIRAWILEQREVVANLIPLGFDIDRDPYSNAYEAADAVLGALTKADQ